MKSPDAGMGTSGPHGLGPLIRRINPETATRRINESRTRFLDGYQQTGDRLCRRHAGLVEYHTQVGSKLAAIRKPVIDRMSRLQPHAGDADDYLLIARVCDSVRPLQTIQSKDPHISRRDHISPIESERVICHRRQAT
jgi:hypothetical protein